jgi:hypothetical protein
VCWSGNSSASDRPSALSGARQNLEASHGGDPPDLLTTWGDILTVYHGVYPSYHAGAILAAKFRPERKGLEALLDPTAVADAPFAAAREVLRRRSQALAPVMAELRACAQAGRLSVPLAELAPS